MKEGAETARKEISARAEAVAAMGNKSKLSSVHFFKFPHPLLRGLSDSMIVPYTAYAGVP